MAVIGPDGPLALARRQLENAVAALADPEPVWDAGVCRWAPAVYVCLRRLGSSRLPCRIDVLTWIVDVDAVVAGWEPGGKGTVNRLHQLAGRGWRAAGLRPDRRLLRPAAAVGGVRGGAARTRAQGVSAPAVPAMRRPLRLPHHQRGRACARSRVAGVRDRLPVRGVRGVLGCRPIPLAGQAFGRSGTAGVKISLLSSPQMNETAHPGVSGWAVILGFSVYSAGRVS